MPGTDHAMTGSGHPLPHLTEKEREGDFNFMFLNGGKGHSVELKFDGSSAPFTD